MLHPPAPLADTDAPTLVSGFMPAYELVLVFSQVVELWSEYAFPMEKTSVGAVDVFSCAHTGAAEKKPSASAAAAGQTRKATKMGWLRNWPDSVIREAPLVGIRGVGSTGFYRKID
jgi:hypothetical protein